MELHALRVRDKLNQAFPQRWFGRRGSIEMPPPPPLTRPESNAILFRGVVKNKFYGKDPRKVNESRDYFHGAFSEIDEN